MVSSVPVFTSAATPDIGRVLQGEFRIEGKAKVQHSAVCVVVYVVSAVYQCRNSRYWSCFTTRIQERGQGNGSKFCCLCCCLCGYVVMWLHARAHLPLLESEGDPAAR